MKTFEEQNNELIAFDKTFNPEFFSHCVDRAMLLIKNREAQTKEEGNDWPIDTESCEIEIENAIINRDPGASMMQAAIEYVESVEKHVETFLNID